MMSADITNTPPRFTMICNRLSSIRFVSAEYLSRSYVWGYKDFITTKCPRSNYI